MYIYQMRRRRKKGRGEARERRQDERWWHNNRLANKWQRQHIEAARKRRRSVSKQLTSISNIARAARCVDSPADLLRRPGWADEGARLVALRVAAHRPEEVPARVLDVALDGDPPAEEFVQRLAWYGADTAPVGHVERKSGGVRARSRLWSPPQPFRHLRAPQRTTPSSTPTPTPWSPCLSSPSTLTSAP